VLRDASGWEKTLRDPVANLPNSIMERSPDPGPEKKLSLTKLRMYNRQSSMEHYTSLRMNQYMSSAAPAITCLRGNPMPGKSVALDVVLQVDADLLYLRICGFRFFRNGRRSAGVAGDVLKDDGSRLFTFIHRST